MNREQTVQMMKKQLDQWNHDIDALAAKADEYQDKGSQQFHETLKSLRIKQENAREQLERVSKANDAAFEDMRDGVEEGLKKVAESFKQAVDRYH
ncbi:MAG: hypothetical protein ABI567_10905 [Gammaproteobacteria bacterium]